MAIRRILAIASVAALFAAVPTLADSIVEIQFGINPQKSGKIIYRGHGMRLKGKVLVANMDGVETPENEGAVLPLVRGSLNFTTGKLSSTCAGAVLCFDGGGSIVISGWVDSDKDGDKRPDKKDIKGPILLSGAFDDVSIFSLSKTNLLLIGDIDNSVNQQLKSYYGINWGQGLPWEGNLNVSFTVPKETNLSRGFSSTSILGGAVTDMHLTPEPGSWALLGTGLLTVAGIIRRKLRA